MGPYVEQLMTIRHNNEDGGENQMPIFASEREAELLLERMDEDAQLRSIAGPLRPDSLERFIAGWSHLFDGVEEEDFAAAQAMAAEIRAQAKAEEDAEWERLRQERNAEREAARQKAARYSQVPLDELPREVERGGHDSCGYRGPVTVTAWHFQPKAQPGARRMGDSVWGDYVCPGCSEEAEVATNRAALYRE